MIYLDQSDPPSEIARTLWRELGPQLCISIALALVEERPLIIIDDLTEVSHAA